MNNDHGFDRVEYIPQKQRPIGMGDKSKLKNQINLLILLVLLVLAFVLFIYPAYFIQVFSAVGSSFVK